MADLTLVTRSPLPLPLPEALAQLETALKVNQRRQAAVLNVFERLCFVSALAQLHRFDDPACLEQAEQIVSAVLALTRERS